MNRPESCGQIQNEREEIRLRRAGLGYAGMSVVAPAVLQIGVRVVAAGIAEIPHTAAAAAHTAVVYSVETETVGILALGAHVAGVLHTAELVELELGNLLSPSAAEGVLYQSAVPVSGP